MKQLQVSSNLTFFNLLHLFVKPSLPVFPLLVTVSGSTDFIGFFITVRDALDTVVENGVFAVSGDDIQINCDMVRDNPFTAVKF